MKKLLRILIKKILFHSLLFVIPVSAQTRDLSEIDSYIQKSLTEWQLPGCAVGIVRNDSVIFLKGYGTRTFGKNLPVDEFTQFEIASCSKAFTTASLAILADRGALNWDDKVIKYLPWFRMYDSWVTNEITIRDLVTHKSGLETFSGDILWLRSEYDKREILERVANLKPVSSFRSKYGYQNLMFMAAAEVIRSITDTSWGDFIRANILNPLGMENTTISYAEMKTAENVSSAHYYKDGKIGAYNTIQKDNASGALGLNSCVSDITSWLKLQLAEGKYEGRTIFSDKQWREMTVNQMFLGNMNYGLGWFIRYRDGKKILNHGGGMPGMISEVAFSPEDSIGIVILTNSDRSFTRAISNYIWDYFHGLPEKDYSKMMLELIEKREKRAEEALKKKEEERAENTRPSLSIEKYCGIYEDKMYGKVEVSIKADQLYMQFIPSPTFRGILNHYQFDTFSVDWEDEFLTRGYIKFNLDFKGNVKEFEIEVPDSPDIIFTELLFGRQKS